jgi:hypothetical protein
MSVYLYTEVITVMSVLGGCFSIDDTFFVEESTFVEGKRSSTKRSWASTKRGSSSSKIFGFDGLDLENFYKLLVKDLEEGGGGVQQGEGGGGGGRRRRTTR